MNSPQHVSHAGKDSTPPAVLMARSRFGRFKPEERVPIRRADVSGDQIQRLRDLRKMIETMNPEDVMNMITFYPKLNTFEALALAKREGALIVPNSTYDRILTETNNPVFLNNPPVWTGTLVIYEAPGRVFGETLIYAWEQNNVQYSISFNVPDKFRDKEGCALVVQHPDFDLVPAEGNSYKLIVANESMVHLIENFPSQSLNWYQYDGQFRIPIGHPINPSPDSRGLWRASGSCYIGLVVRVVNHVFDSRRDVDASVRASVEHGVAVIE